MDNLPDGERVERIAQVCSVVVDEVSEWSGQGIERLGHRRVVGDNRKLQRVHFTQKMVIVFLHVRVPQPAGEYSFSALVHDVIEAARAVEMMIYSYRSDSMGSRFEAFHAG